MKKEFLLLSIPLFSLSISAMAESLESVVGTTLNRNPIIQKELSNYKSANYELESSYSGYKPTIDLTGAIGLEKTKRENTTASTTIDTQLVRREVGVQLRENIFEGFNTSADIEEKKQKVLGARYTVLQAANSLALTTTEAYLQVAYQKELLDLLKESVQTHVRIYKMVRQKAESRIVRRSDIEQTESRVTLAYSNYIAQLKNYQFALIRFKKIYSQTLSGKDITKPQLPALPSDNLEVLESIATQYSPTLLLEEANINGSRATYAKSKSKYYPKIWVDLSAQFNNNLSGVKGENDSLQAMLRGSYNIYNGGSDELTRLKTLQALTTNKESYNNQSRGVLESLHQSFVSEEILHYQIKCLERHVEVSKQTTESYSKEFQQGDRNLLDLLNVELEYNNAREQLLAAKNEQYLARYRIFGALGILPYVLKSDIYEITDSIIPEEIELKTKNLTTLHLKGELDDFIDLNTICEGKYEPIKKEEPVVEEVSKVVANDIKKLQESENEKPKAVVMDSVFFVYKSTEVTDKAKEHLKYLAQLLKDQNSTNLIIYGYSDSIGSAKYNKKLSLERATNVKKVLISLGIDEKRIKAIGVGEAEPIADNSTVAGREKNRRIEFKIVKQEKPENKNSSAPVPIEKMKKVINKFNSKEQLKNDGATQEKFDLQVSKSSLKPQKEESTKPTNDEEIEENTTKEEKLLRKQTKSDIRKKIELEMSEDDIEVQ